MRRALALAAAIASITLAAACGGNENRSRIALHGGVIVTGCDAEDSCVANYRSSGTWLIKPSNEYDD